jgi:putative ABC transport system permease protein
VGKTLSINNEPYAIVGVLPKDFRYPFAADCELAIPLRFLPEELQFRGIHPFFGVARLAKGVTMVQATAEMDLLSGQLERQYPDANSGHAAALLPLRDEMTRELRPALRALLYAVLLVGIIACTNVAGLLLARGAVKARCWPWAGARPGSCSRFGRSISSAQGFFRALIRSRGPACEACRSMDACSCLRLFPQ